MKIKFDIRGFFSDKFRDFPAEMICLNSFCQKSLIDKGEKYILGR